VGRPGGSITVFGSAVTIPNVKTGTLVTCKGGAGAKVPPPGQGVDESAAQGSISKSGTTGPSSTSGLRLEHLTNGSITVACTSSG
jgi:hypothetical protein